jgi:hypothetical protein
MKPIHLKTLMKPMKIFGFWCTVLPPKISNVHNRFWVWLNSRVKRILCGIRTFLVQRQSDAHPELRSTGILFDRNNNQSNTRDCKSRQKVDKHDSNQSLPYCWCESSSQPNKRSRDLTVSQTTQLLHHIVDFEYTFYLCETIIVVLWWHE